MQPEKRTENQVSWSISVEPAGCGGPSLWLAQTQPEPRMQSPPTLPWGPSMEEDRVRSADSTPLQEGGGLGSFQQETQGVPRVQFLSPPPSSNRQRDFLTLLRSSSRAQKTPSHFA